MNNLGHTTIIVIDSVEGIDLIGGEKFNYADYLRDYKGYFPIKWYTSDENPSGVNRFTEPVPINLYYDNLDSNEIVTTSDSEPFFRWLDYNAIYEPLYWDNSFVICLKENAEEIATAVMSDSNAKVIFFSKTLKPSSRFVKAFELITHEKPYVIKDKATNLKAFKEIYEITENTEEEY